MSTTQFGRTLLIDEFSIIIEELFKKVFSSWKPSSDPVRICYAVTIQQTEKKKKHILFRGVFSLSLTALPDTISK